MRLTIITGISGAGRSSALKTLEDIGFLCADNIPPALLPDFAELTRRQPVPPENVAVVTDMRMGDMFESIYDAIDRLRFMDIELDILFLDASDEVLISRFQQTRRTHPISGSGKIISGILTEREKLQRIKEMADFVLDTSTYTTRQLSAALTHRYSTERDKRLLITVITFGYKRGIPMDADLVFDMRFLPNPFYIEHFRPLTGQSEEVRDYVLSFDVAHKFLDTTFELVELVAPRYLEQDKKQIVIGIGCTGGMHRSVAMGEALYERLLSANHRVTIEHRDMRLEQNNIQERFSGAN